MESIQSHTMSLINFVTILINKVKDISCLYVMNSLKDIMK